MIPANCWLVFKIVGEWRYTQVILLHLSSKLVSIFYLKQSDTPVHYFEQKSNQHTLQAVVLKILSFFDIQIEYFHVDIKNPFPMIKSTFKGISFWWVLNWVTVHSQTEKYVENISTPHDRKVRHTRFFQIALKG